MTLTQHADAEPIDNMAFQDAMEIASDDGHDDDLEGSTILAAYDASEPSLALEALAD